MDIVVTGIGAVSALGNTLQASWSRLLAGKSGLALCQPFLELQPRPLGLINLTPASIAALNQKIIDEAIQDAGLAFPLQDCGVVIGSSRSYQGEWERLARHYHHQVAQRQPLQIQDWLELLPGTLAIATAHQIGSQGPVLAPMAACATGLWAIAQGFELLKTGQCQRVIVGAVEAPITPLTLTGFQQMGALAESGAYPFDQRREGLALGEGGAVFVLEPAELARQRSAPIYGKILGFGLTADGHHVSAPDPTSRGAIAAVKQCLERSQIEPSQIDYIHAHGTATQLNDRNEAHLIEALFPKGVAVSSTKGATGHTLGASGALGLAFCLMALKHQILPPCVGLEKPEFDLDFVLTSRPSLVQHTLCFSFGFGGQNVAIALERAS